MRNVPTLLRRELGAYFASVLGYVIAMFFLVALGIYFVLVLDDLLRSGPTQFTVMQGVFMVFWLPALVVVPAITMRLLSEEKRSGTIETLMTAPVTDFELVVSKYLGAVVLYAMMWALTWIYVLILRQFSTSTGQLDLGPVLGGYVGVLVIGQFLIALGTLSSSLSKNQVIAAIMTFAMIFALLLLPYLLVMFSSKMELAGRDAMEKAAQFISLFEHIRDFSRGMVDVRPVVLYLSGTILVLFITTRIVESRKWR